MRKGGRGTKGGRDPINLINCFSLICFWLAGNWCCG